MSGKKLLLLFLVIIPVSVVTLFFGFLFVTNDYSFDFLRIDHCLDGGGCWDYKNKACITEPSQAEALCKPPAEKN